MMLKPWAVEAALARRGGKALTEKELADCKFFTLDSDKVRWPRSFSE